MKYRKSVSMLVLFIILHISCVNAVKEDKVKKSTYLNKDSTVFDLKDVEWFSYTNKMLEKGNLIRFWALNKFSCRSQLIILSSTGLCRMYTFSRIIDTERKPSIIELQDIERKDSSFDIDEYASFFKNISDTNSYIQNKEEIGRDQQIIIAEVFLKDGKFRTPIPLELNETNNKFVKEILANLKYNFQFPDLMFYDKCEIFK